MTVSLGPTSTYKNLPGVLSQSPIAQKREGIMSNGNQVMSPVYDRMLNMRNTYSSVLQGYRSIFATIQSLLVGAGTVFSQFPGNRLPLFALLLSSVGLTVVWYIVCQRRGYDERYFHWQLMR